MIDDPRLTVNHYQAKSIALKVCWKVSKMTMEVGGSGTQVRGYCG